MTTASFDTTRFTARVGTVVKKWTLDALLGVGGMAAVYAATHRAGHRVALKILHLELAHNPRVRERFVREPYIANKVRHPGAVPVLDDDVTDQGEPFFVMELLDGRSLDMVVDERGPLPAAEVLWIACELLDVLVAAHISGITHRDIKPHNVVVTRDGRIKVLDFGIARFAEFSRQLTQIGAIVGTPAFMAPEQAQGQWDKVNAQADVFAVGATMFSLLTGELIHQAANHQEVMMKAMVSPARSLRSVAPHLPEPVITIVDRALAFERDARWPDAAEMQSKVREAQALLAAGDHARPPAWAAAGAASVGTPAISAVSAVSSGRATEDPRPSAPSLHMSTTPAGTLVLDTAAPAPTRAERPADLSTPLPAAGTRRSLMMPIALAVVSVMICTGVVWWRLHHAAPTTAATSADPDSPPTPSAPSDAPPPAPATAAPASSARIAHWWDELPDPEAPDLEARGPTTPLPPTKQRWVDLKRKADELKGHGQYAEAERALRDALAIARQQIGDDDPAYFATLQWLGEVLARQGHYAAAEQVLKEAVDTRAAQRADAGAGSEADDDLYQETRDLLVVVLLKQGKKKEAEAYQDESPEPPPASTPRPLPKPAPSDLPPDNPFDKWKEYDKPH